ncbi:MAG: hypothetical protein ABI343_07905 [Burkholderiaceae bacterium]
MSLRQKHFTLWAAAAFALVVLAGFAMLALRSPPAEAQSMPGVPACQCSAPTSILNMSTTLAHCVCGGVSCIVAEQSSQKTGPSVMQCVK